MWPLFFLSEHADKENEVYQKHPFISEPFEIFIFIFKFFLHCLPLQIDSDRIDQNCARPVVVRTHRKLKPFNSSIPNLSVYYHVAVYSFVI